jgi:segregation and condensation protein A
VKPKAAREEQELVEGPADEAPEPTTARRPTTATTLENVDVINHLLFHKAIISEEDDGSRVNRYLSLVQEGEHTSIRDPFDRSIALAFELVIQNQMNPWDVDLVRFSTMYLEHAQKEKIDLVTAGRIILLAWTVLKLQSDDLVKRTEERKEESQEMDWADMPDFDFSDEDVDFTQRVRMSPRAPIDEKVWHKGDRKVTLMELMEAFETARDEAVRREELTKIRDSMRAERAKTARDFTRGRVHKEDLEEDIQVVWKRIAGLNGDKIPLTKICDRDDIEDFVMAFNSVLFLCRDRKIDLWQEDFPYGPVFLQNLEAAMHAEPEVKS